MSNIPMENVLVVLEQIRYHAQIELDEYFSDVDVQFIKCLEDCDRALIRYVCRAWAQTIDEYKFPMNRKEVLKERFLPGFLKKRWPIKYTRITLKAVYPKIKIPKEEHYVILNVEDDGYTNLTRRLK